MTVLLDGGKLEGVKDAAGKEIRLFSAAQGREMWTAQTPIRIAEPKPAPVSTETDFSYDFADLTFTPVKAVRPQ